MQTHWTVKQPKDFIQKISEYSKVEIPGEVAFELKTTSTLRLTTLPARAMGT